MFGDLDVETGEMLTHAPIEMVRLAIARRVYTNDHLEYVADVLGEIGRRKRELKGYRFTHIPKIMRHFKARFEEMK